MKKIAIILARKGSKRIKNKNIKIFCGKPIIYWTIKKILSSKIFDEVIVSTDSKKIVDLSKKFGAIIPHIRSKKNSDDKASTADALYEVITKMKKNGINFKYACCFYAPAPFLNMKNVSMGFKSLVKKKFDSVISLVRINNKVLRSFFRKPNGQVSYVMKRFKNFRTQDLNELFLDIGQWYWINVNTFKKKREIVSNNTGSLILDSSKLVDIDTPEDWKFAEKLFKKKSKN